MKKACNDTLQPAHAACQPFQEGTGGEICGHVYRNLIRRFAGFFPESFRDLLSNAMLRFH